MANENIKKPTGDNVIVTGNGNDTITTGTGNDSINAGDGNNVITPGGGRNTVVAGIGNDSIYTDSFSANVVNAGEGNNYVVAKGNDTIVVGSGRDTIYANANLEGPIGVGGSVIQGGDGDKSVTVQGKGRNSVVLGNGNDTIVAGGGVYGGHNIEVGDGKNSIYIYEGNSTIKAGNGANLISINYAGVDSPVTSTNTRITTGSGNDTITATFGSNVIDAGDGNNKITLNQFKMVSYGNMPANNTVRSGMGDDTITIGLGDAVIDAGNGKNSVIVGSGSSFVTSGSGNDVIEIGVDGWSNSTVHAGDGNNAIKLGSGRNEITAGAGNDTITLDRGDAVIDAGDGNNSILSSFGNHRITTGKGDDTIATKGVSFLSYSSFSDDVIDAGDGDNWVYTERGNKTITTGSGNDRITMVLGGDHTVNAGAGNNYITSSGWSNNEITAGAGNDTIGIAYDSTANFNTIHAGGGNDSINLSNSSASNTVYLGGGNSSMWGGTATDVAVFDFSANLKTTNYLSGGAGTDTLVLQMTSTELARADVQADLNAYRAQLDAGRGNMTYQFKSINLKVDTWEKLQVLVNDEAYTPASTQNIITGTAGNDQITQYTPGNYIVNSGDGNDVISLGYGNHTITAGNGNAVINVVGDGNHTITAGNGNTVISAGDGNNVVSTGNGNHNISLGWGNQAITTGNGNDTIVVSGGDNQIVTGDGYKYIRIDHDGDNHIVTGANDTGKNSVIWLAGGGNNVVETNGGSIGIGNGYNTGTASGNNRITVGNNVFGIGTQDGDDTIVAGNGGGAINAGNGNNVISSGSGNDTITVGNGTDVIHAGDGNNRITVGYGSKTVVTGSGNDSIYSEDWLRGNKRFFDVGDGDNSVQLGMSDDTIVLGRGNNTVWAGGGSDTVVFTYGENLDTKNFLYGSQLMTIPNSWYTGQWMDRDTLVIRFTVAELARADVQADLARYQAHLDAGGFDKPFQFKTIDLTVYYFGADGGLQIEIINEPPVVPVVQSFDGKEDLPLSLNLLTAVTDVNGDTLALTHVEGAKHGTLGFTADGTVSYLGDPNWSGTETLSYTVDDGHGGVTTGTAKFEIGAVADAPTIEFARTGSTTLELGAVLADLDGSESLQSVTIAGLPSSFTLDKGSYDAATGLWTLSTGDLGELHLDRDPKDIRITLEVTATSQEASNGDRAVSTYVLHDGGDDSVELNALPTAHHTIDGGAGFDTLVYNGAADLDLTALATNSLRNFEQIDLTGGVDSTLTLSAREVAGMTDAAKTLYVTGDARDSVALADKTDWTDMGTRDVGGVSYEAYRSDLMTDTMLYVQSHMTVI